MTIAHTAGLPIVLSLLFLSFIVAELLYKVKVPAIITRKVVHIGCGVVAAMLPLFVSLSTTVYIGIGFSLLLFFTKRAHFLGSIHSAHEDSAGAILFVPSVTLCAILFWPINPLIFQGACLVLALADGLNSIVGAYLGKHLFSITGPKTLEGSIAFFFITTIVLSGILFAHGTIAEPAMLFYIFASSLILACVEALFGKGWDNVFVPLAAGAILFFAL